MRVVNNLAVGMQFLRARIHLAERLHDAGIHRHRHRERLEGRPKFVNAEGRAVEARFRRALPRDVGIELRQRGHGQHFARANVHDDAGGTNGRKLAHRRVELILQRLLDAAGD
jgi:hypothetical protein